jgi:hypothetical protein
VTAIPHLLSWTTFLTHAFGIFYFTLCSGRWYSFLVFQNPAVPSKIRQEFRQFGALQGTRINVVRKSLNKKEQCLHLTVLNIQSEQFQHQLKYCKQRGCKECIYEAFENENLLRMLTGECTATCRETAAGTQTGVPLTQVLASESTRPSFQSVDGNSHASHGIWLVLSSVGHMWMGTDARLLEDLKDVTTTFILGVELFDGNCLF